MQISSLELIQFKNHADTKAKINERIVCFTGLNGMGKTNILDAIFYLSTGKSAHNNIDSQNILKGSLYFTITGSFSDQNENVHNIFCGFTQGKKKVLKYNGVEYDKLIDHYGRLPVVLVSPIDLSLVTEGSEERRKFIDSSISLYDKAYLTELVKYNQVLQQRNSQLKSAKENGTIDKNLLEVYNLQLGDICSRLHPKRKFFIKELEPIFNKFANIINANKEALQLEYASQLDKNNLQELFEKNYDRERILGRTEFGIHKDKLNFLINGEALKKFGSQGQQKSYVLAIKLAQANLLESKTGKKPILLLDDLFDRLDDERATRLLELTDNIFHQIFITDTSKSRLEKTLANAKKSGQFFSIADGKIF